MHNGNSTGKMIKGIRGDCEQKSKDTSSFVPKRVSFCTWIWIHVKVQWKLWNVEITIATLEWKKGGGKGLFLVQERFVDKLRKKCGKN